MQQTNFSFVAELEALTHEMIGESLAADTLAIVLCVHTSVIPKEQRRLNVRVGARS